MLLEFFSDGTELVLAATGTTSSISDAAFQECTDDNRQPGDDTGYPFGWFEFDVFILFIMVIRNQIKNIMFLIVVNRWKINKNKPFLSPIV